VTETNGCWMRSRPPHSKETRCRRKEYSYCRASRRREKSLAWPRGKSRCRDRHREDKGRTNRSDGTWNGERVSAMAEAGLDSK